MLLLKMRPHYHICHGERNKQRRLHRGKKSQLRSCTGLLCKALPALHHLLPAVITSSTPPVDIQQRKVTLKEQQCTGLTNKLFMLNVCVSFCLELTGQQISHYSWVCCTEPSGMLSLETGEWQELSRKTRHVIG